MLESIAYLIIGAFVTTVFAVILTIFKKDKKHDTPCASLLKLSDKVKIVEKNSDRIGKLEQANATGEERDKWIKQTLVRIEEKLEKMNKRIEEKQILPSV